MKRGPVIGLLAVAGLLLTGGIVWATIPDSGGVIHGCYQTSNGNLRVIDTDAGGQCRGGESPLSWSVTGPTGPPGATNVVIRTETETIASGETATFTAFCSSGEVATGGGWRLVGGVPTGAPPVTVLGSVPQSSSPEPSAGETPIGWKVIGAVSQDGASHNVTVFAVCASP
jgi:hypothetical protein